MPVSDPWPPGGQRRLPGVSVRDPAAERSRSGRPAV